MTPGDELVSSGIYFVRIEAGGERETAKLLIVR